MADKLPRIFVYGDGGLWALDAAAQAEVAAGAYGPEVGRLTRAEQRSYKIAPSKWVSLPSGFYSVEGRNGAVPSAFDGSLVFHFFDHDGLQQACAANTLARRR